MTIIVFDGVTLAADRLAVCSNLKRNMTKIWRHGDIMFGGAGVRTNIEAMRNWVLGGCDPAKFPKLQKNEHQTDAFWVINRNGVIRKFEDEPFALEYTDTIFAEGGGRDFAYGAMAMGATAVQAVEIANRYDLYCGGGVDSLSFNDPA
jgi:hypothetical protein